MQGLRGIKEMLRNVLSKYPWMRRKRLQLTYIAVERLRESGREVTVENVVKEARRIIEETGRDIDWGIGLEEYNEAIAAPLLQEPIEAGAIEASPELLSEIAKRTRRRSQDREEPSTPVTGVGLLARPV